MKLIHMYKAINNLAPDYLTSSITLSNTIHNHNTRSSENSVTLQQFHSTGQKTFVYTGSKLWNSLPCSIKNLPSVDCFKKAVKVHFLNILRQDDSSSFLYYLILIVHSILLLSYVCIQYMPIFTIHFRSDYSHVYVRRRKIPIRTYTCGEENSYSHVW